MPDGTEDNYTEYNQDSTTEYFYVVRRYSGSTAQKLLLAVLSRRFPDRASAEAWMRFMETEYPKSEVFIMSKIGDI